MNIKITSLTFLIAAVAGLSFSQAAYAEPQMRGMRFDYAPNEFAIDRPTGHHGSRYAAPHAVVAPIAVNSMPKSLLMDKDFISKPAPPPPAPVVAAAPVAQPSISSKVMLPKSFASLLNPVKSDPALVANAPGQLPAFGHPNVAKLPTPPMPSLAHTNTAIRLLTPQHKHSVVAAHAAPAAAFKMPEVKLQGAGYVPGATIPIATSGGSSASANVHGVLIPRH